MTTSLYRGSERYFPVWGESVAPGREDVPEERGEWIVNARCRQGDPAKRRAA